MSEEWNRLQEIRSATSRSPEASTARVLEVSIDEYHRDPCEEPSLSKTIAKLIVDKSPKHAWAAHPRLGGFTRPTTRAMDDGTIIHGLLLGKGGDYVEIEADSFRTKAAQQMRDLVEATGKVPVLSARLAELKDAANALRENICRAGFSLDGESEVPVEWTERVFCSDATVTCRGMFDHLIAHRGTIIDLKKAVSAHPDDCAKALSDFGGDIQHAAYTNAVQKLIPEIAGRHDFVFLFVEVEPPYCVTPVRPDGQFRALGAARWDRAVRIWHECLSRGTGEEAWPGYVQGVVDVSPRPWAVAREPSLA